MNSPTPETSVAMAQDGLGPNGTGFLGNDGKTSGKYW
jgi:hypothetical protein